MSGVFYNFVNLTVTKQQAEIMALHQPLLGWAIDYDSSEIEFKTERFWGVIFGYDTETKVRMEKLNRAILKPILF